VLHRSKSRVREKPVSEGLLRYSKTVAEREGLGSPLSIEIILGNLHDLSVSRFDPGVSVIRRNLIAGMSLDDILYVHVHVDVARQRGEAIPPTMIWSHVFVCNSHFLASDPSGQMFAGLPEMPARILPTRDRPGL
jgi:hypothetical protein